MMQLKQKYYVKRLRNPAILPARFETARAISFFLATLCMAQAPEALKKALNGQCEQAIGELEKAFQNGQEKRLR